MYAKKLIENLGENWIEETAARAKVLTSYEIACAAGLDKYTSALKLWSIKTGKVKPEVQSIPMWLAVRLRPVITGLYERQSGNKIFDPNVMFQHPDLQFAACRPDAFVVNDDDLNAPQTLVKVAKVHERQFKAVSEELPLKHLVRIIWELGVLGLKTCDFAVLSSADEFEIHTVEFSENAWDQTLQIAAKFLDCVQRDIPPNAGSGDRKLIDKIVGERTETPIDLTADQEIANYIDIINENGDKRRALDKQSKALKEIEQQHENLIMQKMGKSSLAYATKKGIAGGAVTLAIKTTSVLPKQVAGYSFTQLRIK